MLEQLTFMITLKNEHSSATADSPQGGRTCLLTQFEGAQQKLVEANPELAQLLGEFDRDIVIPLKDHFNLTAGREKEPRRDEVNPSKSVWTKFRLSDTLIITVLVFLFVLVSLDIWSHFVAVHGI
ncbi:hypothetical protein EDC04DRAFT_2895189 [Pisolithus marmoratus]|nr:hypothetical protein EDC04DRAFT_2895189 [Pisolithus marmoratus]